MPKPSALAFDNAENLGRCAAVRYSRSLVACSSTCPAWRPPRKSPAHSGTTRSARLRQYGNAGRLRAPQDRWCAPPAAERKSERRRDPQPPGSAVRSGPAAASPRRSSRGPFLTRPARKPPTCARSTARPDRPGRKAHPPTWRRRRRPADASHLLRCRACPQSHRIRSRSKNARNAHRAAGTPGRDSSPLRRSP